MKLIRWLAICALLISPLALATGSGTTEEDKDSQRTEENPSGAQHGATDESGAAGEQGTQDSREGNPGNLEDQQESEREDEQKVR